MVILWKHFKTPVLNLLMTEAIFLYLLSQNKEIQERLRQLKVENKEQSAKIKQLESELKKASKLGVGPEAEVVFNFVSLTILNRKKLIIAKYLFINQMLLYNYTRESCYTQFIIKCHIIIEYF